MSRGFRKALLTAGFALASLSTPVLADVYSSSDEEESAKGFYASLSYSITSPEDLEGNIDNDDWENVKAKFGTDDGGGIQVGLGYDFGNIRTDVTYSQTSYDITSVEGTKAANSMTATSITGDQDADVTTLLFNAYWDFENDSKFTPYLGGGVGSADIEAANFTATYNGQTQTFDAQERDSFVWKGVLGLAYEVTNNVNIFAEGTYTEISQFVSLGSSDTIHIEYDQVTAWGATAGLRYTF
tara:strand:- start:634 stop:1356 length:723 start_codon:yes stop_codon:yes gene_type:complete